MRWASLRSAPPYKGGPSIPQRRLVEARRLGGERAPVETGLRDGVLEPPLVHMRQDQLGERAAQHAPVVAAPARAPWRQSGRYSDAEERRIGAISEAQHIVMALRVQRMRPGELFRRLPLRDFRARLAAHVERDAFDQAPRVGDRK